MLVFGIDVPLIEVILVFLIIIFLLLIEAMIIIILLLDQLKKTKRISELTTKLSETVLAIKEAEIEELDKLRGK